MWGGGSVAQNGTRIQRNQSVKKHWIYLLLKDQEVSVLTKIHLLFQMSLLKSLDFCLLHSTALYVRVQIYIDLKASPHSFSKSVCSSQGFSVQGPCLFPCIYLRGRQAPQKACCTSKTQGWGSCLSQGYGLDRVDLGVCQLESA